MVHNSVVSKLGPVSFPEWKGQKLYMIPFYFGMDVPKELNRFKSTIAKMLSDSETKFGSKCFVMVDESYVESGNYHRRPGLHVDGYWHDGLSCHGGGGRRSIPGHAPSQPGHRSIPVRHSHYPAPGHVPSYPGHGPSQPGHASSGNSKETLLLASNYSACRAYSGYYNRDFQTNWKGGDCSNLGVNSLDKIRLDSNFTYKLDVMSLHESLPVRESVKRTVVRINVQS